MNHYFHKDTGKRLCTPNCGGGFYHSAPENWVMFQNNDGETIVNYANRIGYAVDYAELRESGLAPLAALEAAVYDLEHAARLVERMGHEALAVKLRAHLPIYRDVIAAAGGGE